MTREPGAASVCSGRGTHAVTRMAAPPGPKFMDEDATHVEWWCPLCRRRYRLGSQMFAKLGKAKQDAADAGEYRELDLSYL